MLVEMLLGSHYKPTEMNSEGQRGSLCVHKPSGNSGTYSSFRSSDLDHSSQLTVPTVTRFLSSTSDGGSVPLSLLSFFLPGATVESADLLLWYPG